MSWVKEPHLKKTFAEIESATQSFKTVIGNGGFGEVYKGELFISRVLTSVAVKRLNSRLTGQGLKEFLTEIHLLSECKHPNLISLLAYCQEGNENILVYELAEHGSLDRYLSSDNTSYILPWLQRIKICLGAARGLHYLHNRVGEHHRIIHRDIKSANILLDRNWEAKIADLGLSKIGLANQNNSFLISNVCGTLGYCDPAYMSTGILTKESDVYSFGVVLFEVLCGRLNFLNTNDERRFLSPLARRYYEAKKLDEIIDPKIRKQMDSDSLYKFSAIAYKCLLLERAQRPSMSVVVEQLEEALEFQEKINQGAENMRISDSESEVEMRNVVLRPPIDPSLDDLDISCVQIIRNEDLEELRELSSGSFWTVYHGRWRGTDVAIKRVKKSFFVGQSSEKERLAREFWREADILSKLHHPNIVAFYGVVQNGPEGRLATVTELMLDGSLRHLLLCKDRHLDRHKKLIIALDAAFGMDYLHSKKIIHFDLKCDNLLVNMKDSSRPICKVGDFGMSKIKQISLVSGGVRATLPWMAPELLNGSSTSVSEKVDVFSFGIVLWEILTGEEPYADIRYGAIIGGVVNNTLRPMIPGYCDPEWRRLMEECWDPNPMVRPSFTEIARRLRVMSAACQT